MPLRVTLSSLGYVGREAHQCRQWLRLRWRCEVTSDFPVEIRGVLRTRYCVVYCGTWTLRLSRTCKARRLPSHRSSGLTTSSSTDWSQRLRTLLQLRAPVSQNAQKVCAAYTRRHASIHARAHGPTNNIQTDAPAGPLPAAAPGAERRPWCASRAPPRRRPPRSPCRCPPCRRAPPPTLPPVAL